MSGKAKRKALERRIEDLEDQLHELTHVLHMAAAMLAIDPEQDR